MNEAIHHALQAAIRERRTVTFELDGCRRIAEPHDYGVIDGSRRLFFYQIGGQSRSGRPIGWRWAQLDKITRFAVLDRHFAGARTAPTGRHIDWDKVFASVSRPTDRAADDDRPADPRRNPD